MVVSARPRYLGFDRTRSWSSAADAPRGSGLPLIATNTSPARTPGAVAPGLMDETSMRRDARGSFLNKIPVPKTPGSKRTRCNAASGFSATTDDAGAASASAPSAAFAARAASRCPAAFSATRASTRSASAASSHSTSGSVSHASPSTSSRNADAARPAPPRVPFDRSSAGETKADFCSVGNAGARPLQESKANGYDLRAARPTRVVLRRRRDALVLRHRKVVARQLPLEVQRAFRLRPQRPSVEADLAFPRAQRRVDFDEMLAAVRPEAEAPR